MIRALLISTYDLGRQPFGLASATAWLRRAGAEVACNDLAVEPLDEAAVRAAALVAFHVPMHTATRLAARALARVRALNPRAHLCVFGLYAAMNEGHLRALGAHTVLSGEVEPALAALAARIAAGEGAAPQREPTLAFERLAFLAPERDALPALARYAGLVMPDGARRTVGATEASRGCRHRCRHCPVVPVYDGRFRVVQREVVLEDVRRQVAAGAEHITFGDPDFFNGIGHALPIVRALHAEHPRLTYDVTIKIEHLRRHDGALATLRDTGCLFVTSAVESIDDAVLARLDKGHTRADFEAVARRFRALGLALNPTFVTFTTWISAAGYLDLLACLESLDLVEQVAPVQLAIRLLIPAGSRLLELAEVRDQVDTFDPAALVHPWRHPDPAVDALQAGVHALVHEGTSRGEGRRVLFERAWQLAAAVAGGPGPARGPREPKRAPVPYLTEPWYC